MQTETNYAREREHVAQVITKQTDQERAKRERESVRTREQGGLRLSTGNTKLRHTCRRRSASVNVSVAALGTLSQCNVSLVLVLLLINLKFGVYMCLCVCWKFEKLSIKPVPSDWET